MMHAALAVAPAESKVAERAPCDKVVEMPTPDRSVNSVGNKLAARQADMIDGGKSRHALDAARHERESKVLVLLPEPVGARLREVDQAALMAVQGGVGAFAAAVLAHQKCGERGQRQDQRRRGERLQPGALSPLRQNLVLAQADGNDQRQVRHRTIADDGRRAIAEVLGSERAGG